MVYHLLLSLSNNFLATLFSSGKLRLVLHLSLLHGINVIIMLALINLFVMVGYTFLDSGSSLEAKLLSSSEFSLIAFGFETKILFLRLGLLDLQVVLSCTFDGFSSS